MEAEGPLLEILSHLYIDPIVREERGASTHEIITTGLKFKLRI